MQQTQGSLLGPCTRADAVGLETLIFSYYFPDMGFMVATLAVAVAAAAVRVCKASQNSRQCNCNQCK